MAAAQFELDDAEGEVRSAVLAIDVHWRRLLCGLAAEAVRAGHLRAGLDLDQFVWELCAIYLGHHASARFGRDAAVDVRARAA